MHRCVVLISVKMPNFNSNQEKTVTESCRHKEMRSSGDKNCFLLDICNQLEQLQQTFQLQTFCTKHYGKIKLILNK